MSIKIALEDLFQEVEVHYCYFHVGQVLYRKVCNIKFKTQYDPDHSFAQKVRTLLALSFVPVEDVNKIFDEICQKVFKDDDDIDSLLEYFNKKYVGQKNR